jgi:hypothetical protein
VVLSELQISTAALWFWQLMYRQGTLLLMICRACMMMLLMC